MTQHHRLVVTGDDAVPTQVSKGRKIPRLDIATTEEEADLIITQQAIHLAKEDVESRVCEADTVHHDHDCDYDNG